MGKIKVGILGATGSVGQKFIELLTDHPWFEIAELGASERSAGKTYGEAANWILASELDNEIAKIKVKNCEHEFQSKILFSALDASVAGEIEETFANEGHIVISNARNHRYDKDVPLIIPEVNHDHLELIKTQKFNKSGAIITNPNCSTIGMVLALKPIYDAFGLNKVNVVTMQAISGGGYPGIPSLDILGNVVPYIGGEEDKLEAEPLKILGKFAGTEILPAKVLVDAQCNRVPVIDGHTECVQFSTDKPAEIEEIIEAWNNYSSLPQEANLPSAPINPVKYFHQPNFPQPRNHANLDKGMASSTGRLRKDIFFDYKFVVMSHNTIRGAAGNTILIAEVMKAKGMI